MDEESKIIQEEEIEQNVKQPLMQKEIGEERPGLRGKSRHGSRHHDPLESFLVELPKAAKRQHYSCNQQHKKSNQVDGH